MKSISYVNISSELNIRKQINATNGKTKYYFTCMTLSSNAVISTVKQVRIVLFFFIKFHTIYRHTRVLLGSFMITKLPCKCGVFAFLFGERQRDKQTDR